MTAAGPETVDAEVCVVGGGPGGAAAACKLARLGHDVLIVERSCFPRPHVGEALSAGVWTQLDLLGVTVAVAAAGFRLTRDAVVRWGAGAATVRHGDPPGLLVERGRFDALLLEHARGAGARLLQPAVARRPQRVAGGWSLPIAAASRDLEVRTSFLIDASGRGDWLGGRRGLRVRTGPRTLALYGTWVRRGGWGEATRVEAGPDEWIWAAPRPDGALAAMVFVDAERYRAARGAGASGEALYRGLLARSALLAATAGAELADGCRICDATCWHDLEPAGHGFLKVGEAAYSLDPLSSTGVQKALQSAWSGAIAAHTLLTHPARAEAALSFYRESQRATVERHASWAARFYAEAGRHHGSAFWRRRAERAHSAAPQTPQSSPESRFTRPGAGAALRLSAAARLVETPCIAGDLIEMRRALAHPRLERPVAWLDGIAVAPLLDTLPARPTAAELAGSWSHRMSRERAAAVAAWLVEHGILVEAG